MNSSGWWAVRHLRIVKSSNVEAARARAGHDGTTFASARVMSKLLRGVAAGWGAKKLGGGCLSTIIVFVILWYLLGPFQIFR